MKNNRPVHPYHFDSSPLDIVLVRNVVNTASRPIPPLIVHCEVDPFTHNIVSWRFGNRHTNGGQL